jgi:hypothetical protein
MKSPSSSIYQFVATTITEAGYVNIEWDSDMLFTYDELRKMHRNFFQPALNNLMNLFKRARIQYLRADTRESLEDIASRCDTCQAFSAKPYRFRCSMPDTVVINDTLAIDLLWIDGKAALHVVDLHTHFSAAGFLQRQTVDDVWTALLAVMQFFTLELSISQEIGLSIFLHQHFIHG